MINKIFNIILLFITVCFSNINESQIEKVGFIGAQFLKIEAGARGFGMGNAVDPIVNDASAVFWNPAGLTNSSKLSFFSSNGKYLLDTKQNAMSFSMHLPYNSVVAFSYHGVGSGKMNETTYIDQNGTGNTFSTSSYAMGLGYAIKLTDKFSFGFHWKFLYEDFLNGLDGYNEDYGTGSSFAIDVGTLYNTGYKSLKIGMSIRNFGPDVNLDGTYIDFEGGEEIIDEITGEVIEHKFKPYGLPLTFRFGISADPLENKNQKLTVAIIGENPADNLERLNCGLEYSYNTNYFARLGYVYNHDTRGLSYGFGLANIPIQSLGKMNIDIGFSSFSDLENVWIASVGIKR